MTKPRMLMHQGNFDAGRSYSRCFTTQTVDVIAARDSHKTLVSTLPRVAKKASQLPDRGILSASGRSFLESRIRQNASFLTYRNGPI